MDRSLSVGPRQSSNRGPESSKPEQRLEPAGASVEAGRADADGPTVHRPTGWVAPRRPWRRSPIEVRSNCLRATTCPRRPRADRPRARRDRQPALALDVGVEQLGGQRNVDPGAGLRDRHVELDLHGGLAVDLQPADEPEALRRPRVVTIRTTRVGSLQVEHDRCVDRGELGQSGGRGVVRQDHAVHHEVAVVDHLAEVAAVGEELDAVRGPARQTMITPLPDESAVQPSEARGQGVVVRECARARSPWRARTRT